ncbi:hypothetical protein M501DRAFT_1006521 [Patellaria atrata CBS 101060]|uniref:FAD-binding FR-type domain-containing protein n=1 Tax=Patellaria atrata CBS 101060 TaxID=1346257 RepID=A0A9P4VPL8_9PEZI|nr:hypothetical protein M501DRAFT_1006521 [Patellaria atrata CBS 101060]
MYHFWGALFEIRNNLLLWSTGWDFGTYNNFRRWIARVSSLEAVVHSIGYTIIVIRVLFLIFKSHVEIFNGAYNGFVWSYVVVWLLDRTIWVIRIIYFTESNIIRVVIPQSGFAPNPSPGTYYYLYALNNLCLSDAQLSSPIRVMRGSGRTSPEEEKVLLSSSSNSAQPLLVFLIRPYNGSTSSLLFIVGGSGIAMPLSFFKNLIEDTSLTCSVHIVWAVREVAFLNDFLILDSQNFFRDERMCLSAYITQGNATEILDRPEWPKNVIMRSGRPNVRAEVERSPQWSTPGTLAVIVCGPAQMADDARKAVVDNLSLY